MAISKDWVKSVGRVLRVIPDSGHEWILYVEEGKAKPLNVPSGFWVLVKKLTEVDGVRVGFCAVVQEPGHRLDGKEVLAIGYRDDEIQVNDSSLFVFHIGTELPVVNSVRNSLLPFPDEITMPSYPFEIGFGELVVSGH